MRRWVLVFGLCVSMVAKAQELEPVCGDGRLEAGEFCDDGNTADGDLCSSDCLPEKLLREGDNRREEPVPTRDTFNIPPKKTIKPLRALGLTLASTVLTLGVAPSVGHIYAGAHTWAETTWALRMGVGFTAATALSVRLLFSMWGLLLQAEQPLACGGTDADSILICKPQFYNSLRGVWVGTMIVDVLSEPLFARRAMRANKIPWQFSPMVGPSVGRMSLQVKF